MALICSGCGTKQGFMASLNADLGSSTYICPSCEAKNAERMAQVRQRASSVLLTTTPRVDGYYVERYLGIESVEFVIGTGVFSEISSSIQDFFGARSSPFERKLQTAKKYAMDALRYLAAEKGANAVVGIDLDYTEFSGNRIALIINGTLVKLHANPSSKDSPSRPTERPTSPVVKDHG